MNIGLYISTPDIVTVVTITTLLLCCTYTDIKNNTIMLPVALCAPVFFLGYKLALYHEIDWLYAVPGLIVGVLPYLIMALRGKGGGGDAVLMGAIGFMIGLQNIIYLVLLTSAFYILFGVYKAVTCMIKKEKTVKTKGYPYVPFVLVGWICFLLVGYLL